MCEEKAVARLVAFDFAGVSDEVESVLAFKARNVDPRVQPNYARILYTWYLQRGEYRNGKPFLPCRTDNGLRKSQFSVVSDVSTSLEASRHHHQCGIVHSVWRRATRRVLDRYQRVNPR